MYFVLIHPLMDTSCKNNILAIPMKFYLSFHLTYYKVQTQNYIQILWILDEIVHTKVGMTVKCLQHNANTHERFPHNIIKIPESRSF